jgi:hypothetical protein
MTANPKDLFGSKKLSISAVPHNVLGELAVAMQEGADKYGRHNYRSIPVKASIYHDAVFRHMAAWWEGEDIDPDSKLSHITKAIASLAVLRDAMHRGNWIDDRPQKSAPSWISDCNAIVEILAKKYPNPVEPYIHNDKRNSGVNSPS